MLLNEDFVRLIHVVDEPRSCGTRRVRDGYDEAAHDCGDGEELRYRSRSSLPGA